MNLPIKMDGVSWSAKVEGPFVGRVRKAKTRKRQNKEERQIELATTIQ